VCVVSGAEQGLFSKPSRLGRAVRHDGGRSWLSHFHLASYLFIGAGFWLISAAWRTPHEAARANELATTGPYRYVRHP
jgi:protein-S-isoprenylcysteine O-methyltransferase Ste14